MLYLNVSFAFKLPVRTTVTFDRDGMEGVAWSVSFEILVWGWRMGTITR